MSTSTTYPVERRVVGHFEGVEEPVTAILMPREPFLEAVDGLIEQHDPDGTHDIDGILRPIAEKMDRFPLGTWVDATRGCGCLVGEYLVARDAIERVNAASTFDRAPNSTVLVELKKLHGETVAQTLYEIGTDIDSAMREHLDTHTEERWAQVYDSSVGWERDAVIFFTD